MKSLIHLVFAVGYFAVGLGVRSRTASSLLVATNQSYTSEDCNFALQVEADDEISYLSILADDLGAYELLLGSRTLAAFQLSQETGKCALAVQRSTVASLTEAVNAGRRTLMTGYTSTRKMLTEAKTEQEISEAMAYASKMKAESALNFAHAVQTLSTLAEAGIVKIQTCTSAKFIN